MSKKYSFWKLLRAQWSWKNDRLTLLGNIILAIIISGLNTFLGEVTYTETESPVSGLSLLSILCYLLCYGLNNRKWVSDDHFEMVERYEEILTWRK